MVMLIIGAQEGIIRETVGQKIQEICSGGVRRVLFVVSPEISEMDFRIELALDRRYGCFPPYGAGLVAARLKARGYTTDILDLNYYILSQAHADPKAFRYASWREKLREKLGACPSNRC